MNVIRLGLLILIIGVLAGCLDTSRKAPPEIANKYGSQVILYATSWCGYCKKTRELFARNNIEYFEYDIETSKEGKAEFDKLGGRGIPLVLIQGKVVEGYAPNVVLELARNI